MTGYRSNGIIFPMGHVELSSIALRRPVIDDAAAMWHISDRTAIRDTNSLSHYLLMCRDFSDTSIAAYYQDGLIGFITAYLRPSSPTVLFVWQTAVDPDINAPGLATQMLNTLVDRAVMRGVSYIETSINRRNCLFRMMLRRFAHERGAQIECNLLFDDWVLPDNHEAEVLHRIGPLHNQ